eukprot:839395-Pelagomonas_calceolata.AAC.1
MTDQIKFEPPDIALRKPHCRLDQCPGQTTGRERGNHSHDKGTCPEVSRVAPLPARPVPKPNGRTSTQRWKSQSSYALARPRLMLLKGLTGQDDIDTCSHQPCPFFKVIMFVRHGHGKITASASL